MRSARSRCLRKNFTEPSIGIRPAVTLDGVWHFWSRQSSLAETIFSVRYRQNPLCMWEKLCFEKASFHPAIIKGFPYTAYIAVRWLRWILQSCTATHRSVLMHKSLWSTQVTQLSNGWSELQSCIATHAPALTYYAALWATQVSQLISTSYVLLSSSWYKLQSCTATHRSALMYISQWSTLVIQLAVQWLRWITILQSYSYSCTDVLCSSMSYPKRPSDIYY